MAQGMRILRAGLGILLGGFLGSPLAQAADAIEIEAVMPLTGGGSFLGLGEQKSLQLAEKVVNAAGGINGTPIHFAYHDDQSSPQIAVQLTNEVIASRPAVMLGSSLVAMCSAIG